MTENNESIFKKSRNKGVVVDWEHEKMRAVALNCRKDIVSRILGNMEVTKRTQVAARLENLKQHGYAEGEVITLFSLATEQLAARLIDPRDFVAGSGKLSYAALLQYYASEDAELVDILRFLHYLVPSSLYSKEHTARKDIATVFCPIVLHIHKKLFNTKYNAWDKDDDCIALAFFQNASSIVAHRPASRPHILDTEGRAYYMDVEKDVQAARMKCKGYKNGKIGPLAGHVIASKGLLDHDGHQISKEVLAIYLQMWRCAPHTRVPGMYILDMANWDHVPMPYGPMDSGPSGPIGDHSKISPFSSLF